MSGNMSGKKALVGLAITAAISALGLASAAGKDSDDRHDPAGSVTPCSLAGVNPVYHPYIFGNPAIARSYGFVRSPDGSWHVQSNCSAENQRR
jgi:hypothetical protein